MASTSLNIALVLTAVSNIGPVLNQVQRGITSFGKGIQQTHYDLDQYNRKVKEAEDRMRNFQRMKESGYSHIQGGLLMLAPIEESVRQAARFEGVMKKVETSLYDSKIPLDEQQQRMKKLTEQAIELGNVTTFSNMEAAQAQLALIKNGMEYQDVLKGGAQAAMYLAQTAEITPAAAADAVSQVTNMFQLQGNQLLKVADDINRAANASSAGVQNIMHDLQQTGMSAHTLGLKVKETTLMLGVLHNMGLADASGTYLNDMLINLDKMTPKARVALQAMGWLEGATIQTLKSGKTKIMGGSNSLFDEGGQIRSAEVLIKKLRQVLYNNADLRPEDMRDKAGNLLPQEEIEKLLEAKNKLEALQHLKDVFGIQGMRAAVALATPGKGSYEEMVEKAERAKRIQEQVLEWQETLLGKVETLKGSFETLMTQSGSPFTNEVGKMVADLTKVINAIGNWVNANPKLAASIIKVLGGLALIRIGYGAFMFFFGGMGGIFTSTAGFMVRLSRNAVGFYNTFKYFRQGAGIFRSLWSAVAFGSPFLARIITLVTSFGGRLAWLGIQGLIAGARLAAAWLLGLGPVGWVILGVSALIAAAVAAWKTNFGGFQDFVISVIERVLSVVNKVRTYMGMSIIELDMLKKGAGDFKALEYEKPPVVKTGGAGDDNRQFNFNIQSTDPEQAASEVSSVLGGPGMDKYARSRDPRMQYDDFAFAGS